MRQLVGNWKHWCWSALTALVVLFVSYVIGNTSFPLPDEMEILQWFDKWHALRGDNSDNVPDSLLMVNVCYDKQLVGYEEDGMPVGHNVVTDREKLLRLLTIARQADNYRYLMLDVFFEEGLHTPVDSALFHLIATMPRTCVATHKDARLQDSVLNQKAANADYTITWKETNFSRFQFLQRDGHQTIPLRMYQEQTGKTIVRYGPFYFSDGRLCRNGLTLQMPIRMSGETTDEDALIRQKNYVYLGADLLDTDSIFPVAEQIRDRVVVVGDFLNDRHETYMGSQPGSVICLNAYNALQQGQHFVHWGFAFLLFLLYTAIAKVRLSGWSLVESIRWPVVRMLLSLVSVPALLLALAIVAYWCGLVYNLYVPTLIYLIGDALANLYEKYKTKNDEKRINHGDGYGQHTTDQSRQLQDSGNKQPADIGRRQAGQGGHDLQRPVEDSVEKGETGHAGGQPADAQAGDDGGLLAAEEQPDSL